MKVPEKINRRTNAGKEPWAEWEQENEGKTLLAHEDLTLIDDMGPEFQEG